MFFDAVFLFEEGRRTASFPSEVKVDGLDKFAFLTTPCGGVPADAFASTVFVHNTQSSYFFTWAFSFNSQPCAIVIATSVLYASLFLDFLNAVRTSFHGSEESSDPLCRFGFVKSLLTAWQAGSASELTIAYPFETLTLNLTSFQSWLLDFNVAPLFPYVDVVWRNLMKASRVVIVALTPEIASSAAIAALSLLVPMKYAEPMLLYTDSRDSRVSNPQYKLIATCDPRLKQLENATIIVVNGMDFDDMTDLQQTYRQKTHRYYTIMMSIMNSMLMTNPYFDILETPINVKHLPLPDETDEDLLVKMQRTDTFRRWRRKRISREQIRAAFLSISPSEAVKVVPRKKCKWAIEQLNALLHIYAGDEHFQTVLKVNLRLLTKMCTSERESV